jgi:hypothetical protein
MKGSVNVSGCLSVVCARLAFAYFGFEKRLVRNSRVFWNELNCSVSQQWLLLSSLSGQLRSHSKATQSAFEGKHASYSFSSYQIHASHAFFCCFHVFLLLAMNPVEEATVASKPKPVQRKSVKAKAKETPTKPAPAPAAPAPAEVAPLKEPTAPSPVEAGAPSKPLVPPPAEVAPGKPAAPVVDDDDDDDDASPVIDVAISQMDLACTEPSSVLNVLEAPASSQGPTSGGMSLCMYVCLLLIS